MTTSFFLAVDVGTSRTAAAIVRQSDDGTLVAAPFPLGRHADSAPSVVFVNDGELLFGDAAARRGVAQPERLIREFKRRIGDEVPIMAGDQQFAAEHLYARMVGWVIDAVVEREGGAPSAISVAVPVTWTQFRLDLVRSALAAEGWHGVDLIAEPVAAARHYEFERAFEDGRILAVYDLGGGTFDAVLLRKEGDDELRVIGEPVGIAAFGGSDFDDIVLRHAIAAAGLSVDALASDPTATVALAALRRECIDAKESLSFDSESVIPVLVGGGSATVRLTRAEFEAMIEEGVGRTIAMLAEAFEATGVDLDDVEAILLTGGSSRIPRVAQLLSERFDRPIAIDADPKAIIALGAALVVAERELWAAYYAAGGDELDGAEDVEEPPDASPTVPRGRWPRRAGRKWFRWRTATALAGGTLMLAAGIAVSVGYPLVAETGSPTEPSPTATQPADVAPDSATVVLTPPTPADRIHTPLPSTPPRADAPSATPEAPVGE